MIDPEDQQLIEDARTGNERAFETLVKKYQRQIYYSAYRFLHNHDDADDILQETMIRFYEAIQQKKTIDHLPGWLYRVAVNLAIDKMRYEKRRNSTSLDNMKEQLNTDIVPIADPRQPSPREELITLEKRRLIRKAIEELPLQQRVVTILHDLDGLTAKEIAVILEKAEGTIKATIFSAHNKLQDKLRPLMIEALGEAADKAPPSTPEKIKTQTLTKEKQSQHIHTKR